MVKATLRLVIVLLIFHLVINCSKALQRTAVHIKIRLQLFQIHVCIFIPYTKRARYLFGEESHFRLNREDSGQEDTARTCSHDINFMRKRGRTCEKRGVLPSTLSTNT